MSTRPSVDDSIRELLLLLPRMVSRTKRLPVPESVRDLDLNPRHLALLALLLFDGPAGVNDLAARLEVAPTTVSLMVGDLSRKGVLERREDAEDRRRRIVSITGEARAQIEAWLAGSAAAWRKALEPLTTEERRRFVDTLAAYDRALDELGVGQD